MLRGQEPARGGAGDGQRNTLYRRVTEAYSECTKERGGSPVEANLPGPYGQSQPLMMLPLKAMGTGRLSAIAPPRRARARARSMKHSQIGAWPVALAEDSGADAGVAGKVFCRSWTTRVGGGVGK